MGRSEKFLAALAVLLTFSYVLLRAVYVPTFHDEAATFFHYIVSEKFLPYQAHWDANNHLLNSALGHFCYKVIGPQLWSIRLPNVLAFLLYGYFSFRISATIKRRFLRWMLLLALLTAAFPLEFFSQARGYGMSLAFLLAALFSIFKYIRSQYLQDQLLVWLWMLLAVLANLALLNTYLIALAFMVLFTLFKKDKRWQHLVSAVILGGGLLIPVVRYALELKERGLLYTGFADGFIEVTVQSLVNFQFGYDSITLATFIALIAALAAAFLLVRVLVTNFEWSVGRLSALFLLANAMGSLSLNWFFGMNFPENRVGLYYIPLFLISSIAALDEYSNQRVSAQWITLLFLVFPIDLLNNLNLNTTRLWKPWHGSNGIYTSVQDYQKTMGRPLTISGHYLNELGWAYYNFTEADQMQLMQRDPVPDTLADVIVARPYDFSFMAVPYDTLFHDSFNDVYALKRNTEISWAGSIEIAPFQSTFSGSDEFYEILNNSPAILPGLIGKFELKATIDCPNDVFQGQIVIASSGPSENDGTYNFVPLHWIQPSWHGDTLKLYRTYQFTENAENVKIYIWNIDQQQLDLQVESLRLWSIAEEN